jgi:hypothetical protein
MTTSNTYKPDFGVRVIFIFLFGFLFIIYSIFFLMGKRPSIGLWLFSIGLMMLPQLWLSGQLLILIDDQLKKVSWFFFCRRINLSKIIKAKYVMGPIRSGPRIFKAEGMLRLELYDDGEFKKEPFAINIKVYTRSALHDISKAIIDSAKGAKIDQHIINFSSSVRLKCFT